MKKILSLIVIYFLLTGISWGDMGHSQEGKGVEVTLTHTSALDSAWVIFTCNGSRYDSIKVTPIFGSSSRFLAATDLDLDSICNHSTEIRMYRNDTWLDTLTGGWLHENPNLVSSDNIGINWGDITNKGSTVALNATTTKRSLDEYALLTGGASGLGRIVANQADIYAEVANIDAWNPITDNDSLIIDRTSNMPIMAHINYDSMLAHAADFKATGFATSADGDSITQAIDDANKENFKFGGADSLRAFLAEHDSTLLEQAAAASGAGSEQETLYVLDGDGNAVQGATVTWYNSTNTPYALGATNVNGYKIFQIDPATYTIAVTQVGIHNILDTLTITADGRDTILVVAYGAGSSPGSDSICVEGWLFGEDGTEPKPGARVIFSVQHSALMDTSTDPHILIEKFAKGVQATVSDSGHWRIYLPASINLVPWKNYKDGHWTSSDTVFYNMKIERRAEGTIWEEFKDIFIADTSGCLNIEDIPFR